MKITKTKRQLMLGGLVLLLGAAVFANWYFTNPEKSEVTAEMSTDENDNVQNYLGDAILVGNTNSEDEYFASAKLSRDKSYDEAVATLMEIIECSEVDEESIKTATDSMNLMVNRKTQQADIENLITAKTGRECVVVLSDKNAEVIISENVLTDSVILQIKEIVVNNSEYSFEKILIIPAK